MSRTEQGVKLSLSREVVGNLLNPWKLREEVETEEDIEVDMEAEKGDVVASLSKDREGVEADIDEECINNNKDEETPEEDEDDNDDDDDSVIEVTVCCVIWDFSRLLPV